MHPHPAMSCAPPQGERALADALHAREALQRAGRVASPADIPSLRAHVSASHLWSKARRTYQILAQLHSNGLGRRHAPFRCSSAESSTARRMLMIAELTSPAYAQAASGKALPTYVLCSRVITSSCSCMPQRRCTSLAHTQRCSRLIQQPAHLPSPDVQRHRSTLPLSACR